MPHRNVVTPHLQPVTSKRAVAFAHVAALVFTTALLMTATAASGQDVELSWAGAMGGTFADAGYGVAVDASGNVYTTGLFRDTADFDPGTSTANLTSAGGQDVYVSKLDPTGAFLWAAAMGGTIQDWVSDITVDASGNVYTTGYFGGTADFDPGPGIANLSTAGGSGGDIFVSKLDASGNYVWAKAMVGTGTIYSDWGDGIAVDASGNVYATGGFYDTVDFDPGAGTANLTSAGYNDIFIFKLDASGNLDWVRQIGGTEPDQGTDLVLDASGNVYVTGHFRSTVDFDPGPGTANLTAVNLNDIFVAKFDASGNYVWAKGIGSVNDDTGNGIAVDSAGNVFATGEFAGTADFDPGAGTANLTAVGGFDIFVLKLDASGNYVWAKAIGDTGLDDTGYDIAVDLAGSVYTTGSFDTTVDFDPGAGTAFLTSGGGVDIFVQKLNASGTYVWAKSMGGTNDCRGLGIDVNAAGNVYTTGYFLDTADFDPGAGTAYLTSSGAAEIFVTKFILSATTGLPVGDGWWMLVSVAIIASVGTWSFRVHRRQRRQSM